VLSARLTAVAAVLLTLTVTVAPTAGASRRAGGHHPAVEVQTYQVRLSLSGTYHEETRYTDAATQFYCPGTGQVLDAHFTLVGTATLKVKLAPSGSSHKTLSLDDSTDNGWSMDLATVAIGDDCSAIQNDHCEGATRLNDNGGSKNFAYSESIGTKIVFGTELVGTPTTADKPGDCKNNAGFYPGGEFTGLSDALSPYVSSSMAVSIAKLEKLKKGHTIDRSYKPLKVNIPQGYDVSTCNHDPSGACSASLNGFIHLLTIKRVS
jgi:hypothetical protein